ncbi:MAG: hypothetical protein R2747_20385 [Pyrinomonadaceae bacterium]
MIDSNLIEEILRQYQKHGWNLRRVLLLPETRENLGDSTDSLFGETVPEKADFDGLWFSRPSPGNREAWELRHLSETPFALFEAFAYDADEDFRSKKLSEMETRLKNRTS